MTNQSSVVNGQNHFITAPRPEPSYGLKHEAPKGGKCELLHSALPMHAEEVEEWDLIDLIDLACVVRCVRACILP